MVEGSVSAMHLTSSHCKTYACILAQAEAGPLLTVIFLVAVLATALFLGLRIPTEQNEKEYIAETELGGQIEIEISNSVPIPIPSLHKTPQDTVTNSGCCALYNKNEVESNENVAVIDQTNVELSYTDSLQKALIAGQKTSSFRSEHLDNLLPEARQTTSRNAEDDSRATSQIPQQRNLAAAVAESEAQVLADLETAVKVAYLVIPISVGCISTVLAGLLGNKKTDLTHMVLIKAFTSLSCISFFSAVFLFLLTLIHPSTRGLVMIVKLTMWITLGSITYAIGCATSTILLRSLIPVVFFLIAPLVLVFLLVVLGFCGRRN